MRKLLLITLLTVSLLLLGEGQGMRAFAQPPPPPPPQSAGAPIDTNVALLLFAVAAYGVWKIKNKASIV